MRGTRVVIAIDPRYRGRKRIKPGRKIGHDIAHRQAGGHIGIEPVFDRSGAAPDFLSDIAGEFAALPLRQPVSEKALLHGAQQVAVIDPAQHKVDPVKIDCLHRKRRIGPPRQHIGPARENDLRAAVAHVKAQIDVADQAFAAGRGQALTQGQCIACAVARPFDTQFAALGTHCHGRLRQAYIIAIVDRALDQGFGKRGAQAGCGQLAFDTGACDAETVFAHGFVQ